MAWSGLGRTTIWVGTCRTKVTRLERRRLNHRMARWERSACVCRPMSVITCRSFLVLERPPMKSYLAMLALLASLASTPLAAQIFSWDPLQGIENALPGGAPNEE